MNRGKLNFLIDTSALILFVFLTVTGVLMRYVLPPGTGRFAAIWGLNRHDWGQVHFWVSISILAVLSLHLFLHWRWITCVLKGMQRQGSGFRLLIGVAGLAALLGMAFSPLFGTVKRTDYSQPGMEKPASHSFRENIRGSMTLNDLELSTSMPYKLVLKELKLPQSTSSDEKLGRLSQLHEFTMEEVREAVRKYRSQGYLPPKDGE